jgi:hypothetical protein
MADGSGQTIPPSFPRRALAGLWWFCCHRLTRYVAAWLVAISVAGYSLWDAYTGLNDPHRADGSSGHTTIDFGGQWLMGRLLVEGQGRHLYHRDHQREILMRFYPVEDQSPSQERDDADQLMIWLMGEDDPRARSTIGAVVLLTDGLPRAQPMVLESVLSQAAARQVWRPDPVYQAARQLAPLAVTNNPIGKAVLMWHAERAWPEDRPKHVATGNIGGPLYPPVNSLYFYPLGLLRPRDGYRVSQVFNLVLAFVAGLGLRHLSGGRVWWPLAAVWVVGYSGFSGTITLGQNATLTLAIVVWGWTLIARGRPGWGGVVWGLLAFKPVWALAIFLVPVVTRRWRVCLTMTATGVALALATLPFLGGLDGVRVWRDWWHVGGMATELYNIDGNWIFLSRDLLSIPRRWMYDFDLPNWARDPNLLLPGVVGWILLLLVLEPTVRLAVLRKAQARATTGPPAAFLFLAAWMTCFHFMYYDLLLSALPVFLLLAEPGRFLRPRLLAIRPLGEAQLGEDLAAYYRPRPVEGQPPPVPLLPANYGHVWVVNSFVLTLIAVLLFLEHIGRTMGIEVSARGACLDTWPALAALQLKQPLRFSTDFNGTPIETGLLFLLWLWCGWQWLRTPRATPTPPSSPSDVPLEREATGLSGNGPVHAPEFVQLGADVGGAHERLAD